MIINGLSFLGLYFDIVFIMSLDLGCYDLVCVLSTVLLFLPCTVIIQLFLFGLFQVVLAVLVRVRVLVFYTDSDVLVKQSQLEPESS